MGVAAVIRVPELGPSLGRLGAPPVERGNGAGDRLDEIRLRLVTEVFELAGASRARAGAGDGEGARGALSRSALLALWEQAVAGAAARITGSANAGLRAAAAESRYPDRRLRGLLLTPDDTRAVAARLGSGGAGFVAALDTLEHAARAGSEAEWSEALTAAARRLEGAWLALEEHADAERRRWGNEIARVRAWRRPTWPLWLFSLLVFAGATWIGLILGGYIPVPGPLEEFARWWWGGP